MQVMGFRGKVRDVDEVLQATRSAEAGVFVQLLDASLVCGPMHLEQAARLARRAFQQARNSARELGLELLLYASGERQLDKALTKMGVTKKTTTLAVCVLGVDDGANVAPAAAAVESALERFGWSRDDDVLVAGNDKLRRFGVTAAEIETVGESRAADLVLERVALVDALK
jgi:KEOPS complex subunit Cgi121